MVGGVENRHSFRASRNKQLPYLLKFRLRQLDLPPQRILQRPSRRNKLNLKSLQSSVYSTPLELRRTAFVLHFFSELVAKADHLQGNLDLADQLR
jgi:hypothetical protein